MIRISRPIFEIWNTPKHLVQSIHPVTCIFLLAFLKLDDSELFYFCGRVNAGAHASARNLGKKTGASSNPIEPSR